MVNLSQYTNFDPSSIIGAATQVIGGAFNLGATAITTKGQTRQSELAANVAKNQAWANRDGGLNQTAQGLIAAQQAKVQAAQTRNMIIIIVAGIAIAFYFYSRSKTPVTNA